MTAAGKLIIWSQQQDKEVLQNYHATGMMHTA